MELTPEQQAKAKVLFEYEEAKKALAQRRDDIHLWGKSLIAIGEAVLNHPATIVLNGQKTSGECLVASGEQKATAGVEHKATSDPAVHRSEDSPARPTQEPALSAAKGSALRVQPSTAGVHHAYPKPSPPHQDEEQAPHCETRYLNAERLANLVAEFRELSQRVVELEQQKKHIGYFN